MTIGNLQTVKVYTRQKPVYYYSRKTNGVDKK